MEQKKRIGYVLVILAITLACVPALPVIDPLPTQPVGAVDTIVAATSDAESTATALVMSPASTPRATFTPSKTPTITPTFTATIVFHFYTPTPLPTATKSSGGGGGGGGGGSGGGGGGGGGSTAIYNCKVLGIAPKSGTIFAPGRAFVTTWEVMNTGNREWDVNSVDYLFDSGTHLHLQALYNISHTIQPGDTIDLDVDMRAPLTPGTYYTIWRMRRGEQGYFCNMKQVIIVQ